MDKKKVKIGIVAGLVILVGALVALIYTGYTTFVPAVVVLMLSCVAASLGMSRKRD